MQDIHKSIIKKFGNKLRIRVCGLCIEDDKILMVNHHSLNESGEFWGPPGGGMEFGSSAEENLKREFFEETGIRIEVEKFLFVHEYLSPPLHAIELIFKVKRRSGNINIGYDPEMKEEAQIIKDVNFVSLEKLKNMDKGNVHQLFLFIEKIRDIDQERGYYLWKT